MEISLRGRQVKQIRTEKGWETVGDYRNLSDGFYDYFYCSDIDKLPYKKGRVLERMIKKYNDSVEQVKENDPSVFGKNDWLCCDINGGVFEVEGGALGRFYFNVKPEKAADIFRQVVENCQNYGLHISLKMPGKGSLEDFNRWDKIMLYFNSRDEEPMLECLASIYKTCKGALEKDIPRFSAQMKDEKGKIMTGISFGAEPRSEGKSSGLSFGQARAKILADVFYGAHREGKDVWDKDFDLKSTFDTTCSDYQVDPDHPAFNLPKPGETSDFSYIKERIRP